MTSNRDRDPAVWAFAEHEHRDLARGINRIHDVACEVGQAATPELSVHLLEVLDWLDSTLAPHIAWEEAWLYPEIDARIGTPWATRAARFDHRQIREMATHLRADHDLLRGTQGGDQDGDPLPPVQPGGARAGSSRARRAIPHPAARGRPFASRRRSARGADPDAPLTRGSPS